MAEHVLSEFSSVPVIFQHSDDEVLLDQDEVRVSLPNDREFFTTLRHYVQRQNQVLDALLEDNSIFTTYTRESFHMRQDYVFKSKREFFRRLMLKSLKPVSTGIWSISWVVVSSPNQLCSLELFFGMNMTLCSGNRSAAEPRLLGNIPLRMSFCGSSLRIGIILATFTSDPRTLMLYTLVMKTMALSILRIWSDVITTRKIYPTYRRKSFAAYLSVYADPWTTQKKSVPMDGDGVFS
jgi:hypothetical protein